ncbi:hypothetical protein QZH41_003970 [Actinostola sp. cb2023]|nr:hypothetical protein QZH41_003970 [Actinostola sp. cb2023]
MVSPTALFVRFPRRKGRVLTRVLLSKRMRANKWKFVAATYNRRTGFAEVYVDGRRVLRRRIGKIRVATNYPIRMGSRKGDPRSFKGRMACLQIYNTALNGRQIRARKNVCFAKGPLPRKVLPGPAGRICRAKIDIAILMDSSGSIEYYGKGNYNRMRIFVQRLIASFAVGRRLAHISVSLFSKRPQLLFGLNRYYSKYQMMRAVGRAPYIRGGTLTGKALNFVRQRVFRLRRGRRGKARRKILVVMTDGRSQDKVKIPALVLKRLGVDIISIGIGKNYLQKDLLQMASSRHNVFTSGFRTLQRVATMVKRRACRKIKPVRPVVPKPKPYFPKPRPHGQVCRRRLDLAFIVDGSGSIGLVNFKRTLNFVRHLVASFVISPSQTRIAFMEYNTRPFRAFTFGQKRTLKAVLASVSRIPYVKGGTKTGRALGAAFKFFKGRSTRTRVAVVLTDGKSHDNVAAPAKRLRKHGVHIIAVGTGTRFKVRERVAEDHAPQDYALGPSQDESQYQDQDEDVLDEDEKDEDAQDEDEKDDDAQDEDEKDDDALDEDEKDDDALDEDEKDEDEKDEDEKDDDAQDEDEKDDDALDEDEKDDDAQDEDEENLAEKSEKRSSKISYDVDVYRKSYLHEPESYI